MKRKSIIAAMLFLSMATVCSANTILVPAEYSTIQAAIDAANNGDMILVAAGTYVENLNFCGKAVTLKSSNGATNTVIDGNQTGSVIVCFCGEGPDTVIDGFTLTNGSGYEANGTYGGGIYCHGYSSPTIKNNIIEGNSAEVEGGGIYCRFSSSPVITNNMIRDNTAQDMGGAIGCRESSSPLIKGNVISDNFALDSGGGILCYSYCSPEIVDNQIIQNSVEYAYGGGICCHHESCPIISGNTIAGGYAVRGGGIICVINCHAMIIDNIIQWNVTCDRGGLYSRGGGINCWNCSPYISNNTISFNSTEQYGGGIYTEEGAPVIIGNTLSFNDAEYSGAGLAGAKCFAFVSNNTINGNVAQRDGGGIHTWWNSVLVITSNTVYGNVAWEEGGGFHFDESSPTLTNNTIFDNRAERGGGISCNKWGSPVVTNSILWGNSATSGTGPGVYLNAESSLTIRYSDVEGGQSGIYQGGGTLYWGAGMIDLDPLLVDPGKKDFHLTYISPCREAGTNAAPWLSDFDIEGDPRIVHDNADMGSDEFDTHLYFTGAFKPDGMIKAQFVGLPDSAPVGLFIGSGVLDPPLQHVWGDFFLASPWIAIPLIAIPSYGVLQIPGRLPMTPPAPYDIYMQALIGDRLTNLFVMEVR